MLETWKDPEYSRSPKKVLVYILSLSADVRTLTENVFIERLKEHGISGVAAHNRLAPDLVIDKEAVKKIVQEEQVDMIFIGKPGSRKDRVSLRPNIATYQEAVVYDPDDEFYTAVAGDIYMPGTYSVEDVSWQLVVYDVTVRKRVWTAQFESFIRDNRTPLVKPAVDRIMKMIVADKIIP